MARRKGSSKKPTADMKESRATFAGTEFLQQFLATPNGMPHDDALYEAQQLIYDAWQETSHKKRIALAKKALALSPHCADAYVMLAEDAALVDEQIALYRQGVEAGEKSIGPQAFGDDVGRFWGLLETRPYMRARHKLAMALWDKGEHDEAITHYTEMLRLNPADNQGIRYLLVNCLLADCRHEEAGRLLDTYPSDGAADWMWSRALLTFRLKGENAESHKALAQALKTNAHVRDYLLGRRKMPRQLPEYISWGGQDEAVAYVHGAAETWAATPKAFAWLASALPGNGKTPPVRRGASARPAVDTDRIDDAVLALLLLGLHDGQRTWKSFDWDAMGRLHAKGYISDPISKAKSVVLTEEGLARAEQLFQELFVRPNRPTETSRRQ
jgi:tetratricopeptide (TPR) repeat protein